MVMTKVEPELALALALAMMNERCSIKGALRTFTRWIWLTVTASPAIGTAHDGRVEFARDRRLAHRRPKITSDARAKR